MAILESSLAVSEKLNMHLLYNSAIVILDTYPSELKTYVKKKNLCPCKSEHGCYRLRRADTFNAFRDRARFEVRYL